MKIKVASIAGFCWGVKRAFDKVLAALAGKHTVHTIGPLVHNEKAINMLERRGLRTCNTVSEIESGTVVIRAHGIPPDVEAELRARNITLVDATCPHVRKIQRKVEEGAEAGMHICIVGYRDHPEVEALVARAGKNCSVITSEEEIETIPDGRPLLLLAQSTFNNISFEQIRKAMKKRNPNITVFDSVCQATIDRQKEVMALAQECEVVIVVGSRHSSNTKRLVEIAEEQGAVTHHVTSAGDLDLDELSRYDSIGVTAGASTPNWVMSRVVEILTDLGDRGARSAVRRVLLGCIESGLYASAGAAALTITACMMQDIELRWTYLAAAFCYIFSIYTLNRLQREAEHPPPTRREAFLQRHRRVMSSISIFLALTALAISVSMGALPAALVGASYLLGIAYGVRVSPHKSGLHYERLQDVPASKDLFEAGAWTMICCIVPFTHAVGPSLKWPSIITCLFVFTTVFAKATMYDSLDIQGDRVLGRETLPAVLGEKWTWRILWMLTVCACLAVLLESWYGPGKTGLFLLAGPLYAMLYLPVLRRGLVGSEDLNAAIVDGELFLLGLISYIVSRG